MHSVLAGAVAFALSTGAQATVFYGTGGSGLTSSSETSAAIDFGSVVTSFASDAALGLTVSSLPAATLTAAVSEGLQTVQGFY